MNKKRIISYVMLLITFVIMLTGCTTSEKIPIPKVEKDVYIYDEDNIIDDDVEEKLNKMLVELEKKSEVEFVVVSVESLLDRSIEVTIPMKGNIIRAEQVSTDMYVSIDLVEEIIERQLRKYKNK